MFLPLFNVMAPVLLCIAAGWLWARLERPFDTRGLAELVTLVGTPCLIFATLTEVELEPRLFRDIGLATLTTLAMFGLAGAAVLRLAGLPQRTYLPPLMFANIGNMGLPLCLFAFGETGLALAIVVLAVVSIVNFTVGIWLYSGASSVWPLLRSPLIYATLAAFLLLALEMEPPQWLHNTTALLGGFTIPVMLLTLGVSLARLRVSQLPGAGWLSALRIAMGVAVGWAVAELFQLEGVARGVLILQSAMPVAVFNYLFAVHYGRDPEMTAGLVVVSTVLSMITLPPLLLWLM